MIIDSHVHYGHGDPGSKYPPVDELLSEAKACGVDRVIHVTPTNDEWNLEPSLAGYRKHPDTVMGIIGRFDPLSPDVESRLREYKAIPGILGIRVNSGTKGAENWLPNRTLDPFFAAAEKLDVAVQLYFPYQNVSAKETAHRFPKLRILIDHMGLRIIEGVDNPEPYREWPELIALAAEPNVWIKCSYFPEAAYRTESYPFKNALGYFKALYESAGAKKLIWGSNFPPVRRACSYREAVDFVRVHSDFLSPSDRDAIMGGNFLEKFAPAAVKT